jgi:hypothetical protein
VALLEVSLAATSTAAATLAARATRTCVAGVTLYLGAFYVARTPALVRVAAEGLVGLLVLALLLVLLFLGHQ